MIRINVIWLQCIRFQSFATINTCNFLIEGFSQICIFQTDAKYISINESTFIYWVYDMHYKQAPQLCWQCVYFRYQYAEKITIQAIRPYTCIWKRYRNLQSEYKDLSKFLYSYRYLYHFIHTGLSWLLNHVFS